MLSAIERIREAGGPRPTCVGIHAVFADDAYAKLAAVARVVTCNTIRHVSNAIDIAAELAGGVRPA